MSLGGVESPIEHPASMPHSPLPAAERAELAIIDTLIRVSVDIEHSKDLLADLETAFEAVDAGRAEAGSDAGTEAGSGTGTGAATTR